MSKRKVLLMGKSGAGKTSMRSIIFANYIARDTNRLGPTIEVEHAHIRFLGNLVLHLWDCGGQETFMENYLQTQKDLIFKNVQVLIYVFDVESRECERDYRYYQNCLDSLIKNSENAKVFCLVHKMDLIQEDHRDQIFEEKCRDIFKISEASAGSRERAEAIVTCYKSSIWDETLYKAWSAIVYRLIPNVAKIEEELHNFAEVIEATEVLLFERETFLVIAHAEQGEANPDMHRFEKVSNIIKQFKLSCRKMGSEFDHIHLRNGMYGAFIEGFTSNTFIMVILSDETMSAIGNRTVLMNVRLARRHFEKLEEIEFF